MLKERIESHNPSIDNLELMWVDEIIKKMSNNYEPTKNDLLIGNMYWKKWKKQLDSYIKMVLYYSN